MSIRIRIEPDARLRQAVLEGTVGDDDLVDAYAAVLGDPDFDPTLNDLVDARGVRRIDVTPAGIRRLADVIQQVDRLALPTKIAVVVSDDDAFEVARMYESLRAAQHAPAEHRVFRDMAEAREWLGLEPEGRHSATGVDSGLGMTSSATCTCAAAASSTSCSTLRRAAAG
jgi:hypothetical protein